MFFSISVTLIISIALLPAIDMIHAYVDAKHALMISTNAQLNAESNAYFSTSIRSFSLMHFWYICIFLQAILLFACIFYIWNKLNLSKKWRIISVSILALLSLAIQLQHLAFSFKLAGAECNVSTYCWTSARIWEFIYGGLLSLIPCNTSSKFNNTIAIIALGTLISLSFLPIPHANKIIPIATIISGFLLLHGKQGLTSSLLNSRFFFTLGKYSFSLYLIHWPVIWIMEYLFNFPLSATTVIYSLLIIIPLTLITYRIYEKRKTSVLKFAVTALLAPILALSILLTEGFKDYIRVEQNNKILYNSNYTDKSTPIPSDSPLMKNTEQFIINLWGKPSTQDALLYHMGDSALPPTFVLLGDSHANHLRGAFDYLGKIHHWSGIFLNSYVHPFYGAVYQEAGVPDHENTEKKHEVLINWLKEQSSIKYVVVSQWWSKRYVPHELWNGKAIPKEKITEARTQQLRQFCERITKLGKRIIIIADTPSIKERNPLKYRRKALVYGRLLSMDTSSIICTEKQFAETSCETFRTFKQIEEEGLCIILKPHVSLFKNGIFSAIDEGHPVLGDNNHLTMYGAIQALSPISTEFSTIINEK